MKRRKGILSLVLAVIIGLSASIGTITQKVFADENFESFAMAQTAMETITPKRYENFKQVNEMSARSPTNSFKSVLSMPKDGERDSLYLKVNIPVRCSLDIYTTYISDDNSSDEMDGSLYNANGVKQDTHNVLEPGLYYYALSLLTNCDENPIWKVYAYYLPVGEELTETGQKYTAYGKSDRLNKVLPQDTIGKITYAPGPTIYKFVAKQPGFVYMEIFDEYGNGDIKYIEDNKFTLYDSKMKVIQKEENDDGYKLDSGMLELDHAWQGVSFNVKKKGTYYLKMTGYKGTFAYHIRFLKGLSVKAVVDTRSIFEDTPAQLVRKYLKDKSLVYSDGSNNLYINEPPLIGVTLLNSTVLKSTDTIKWKKVKTAQKYLIRRYYSNKKHKVVHLKNKYTKKTYYKVTKKDMAGNDYIEVMIHPVRNGEIGPGGHSSCDCIVIYKKGKFMIHGIHGD